MTAPTIEIAKPDIWLPGASADPRIHPNLLRRPGEGTSEWIDRVGTVIICGGAPAQYGLGRQAFAAASVTWTGDTIKAALVTNGYSPAIDTHQFLSDLGANVVGTDQTLGNKHNVLGTLDADPSTWSGSAAPPSSATPIAFIIIYKFVSTAGNSPLLFKIDTATNLPLTPNGGSVSVTWSTGVNKIATI